MIQHYLNTHLRRVTASVFVKCAALMILTTLAVAIVLTFTAFRISTETVRASLRETAQRSAESGAVQLFDALRFNALDKIAADIGRSFEEAGENGIAAFVLAPDGTVVSEVGDQDSDRSQEAMGLARGAVAQGVTLQSSDGFIVAVPVRRGAEQPAVGSFTMIWTPEAAIATLRQAKVNAVVQAALVFLVMLAVTTFLLKRLIARPVNALEQKISQVSDGNYDTASGLEGRRDEFGAIARQLASLTEVLSAARTAESAKAAQAQEQSEVVRSLSDGLVALADGVLTHSISRKFPDAYEALRQNYNTAVTSLRDAIFEVKTSADSIRSGADEIHHATESLSHRTETQAATLEQTAAALDELVSSVKSAADGARQVDTTVKSANAMTEQNATIMKNAVAAMSEIEKSSEQISEIIAVIDDIAFQTNLLALNAGVEAARAGTAGKGFAVVASEVRALAQRSSGAAQQIKSLISGSSIQVKTGAQLVEQAGTAMLEVVDRVQHISGLVGDIAHGAQEQSMGINEINIGVTSLDQVTQKNAAMVEESSAAALMLSADAQSLAQLVGRFELTDHPSLTVAKTGAGGTADSRAA